MNDSEVLNSRFSRGSQIRFRQLADGIVVAEIDTPLATATISLYEGHVVSWRPKHQVEPVLWVSKRVQFKPAKAIRGGVPTCWPWFGAHPIEAIALSAWKQAWPTSKPSLSPSRLVCNARKICQLYSST